MRRQSKSCRSGKFGTDLQTSGHSLRHTGILVLCRRHAQFGHLSLLPCCSALPKQGILLLKENPKADIFGTLNVLFCGFYPNNFGRISRLSSAEFTAISHDLHHVTQIARHPGYYKNINTLSFQRDVYLFGW